MIEARAGTEWTARMRWAGLAASLAALAGCGQKEEVKSTPTPPPASMAPAATAAVPGRTPQQRYQVALQAMQQGDAATARTELTALLQARPGDRRATMLLRQIDTDPKQLYGSDSFSYPVVAGDTLFSLSRKYLHDPLNFYGLARFNNLTLPVDLQPGQSILIPGRPRAPARAVAPPPPRRPQPSPASAASPTAPAASAPAAPAEPSVTSRNEAQQLRRQGLEQMSAGSIDRAVTLLSQAASLDPGNRAIAADLARAKRIQATVHGK